MERLGRAELASVLLRLAIKGSDRDAEIDRSNTLHAATVDAVAGLRAQDDEELQTLATTVEELFPKDKAELMRKPDAVFYRGCEEEEEDDDDEKSPFPAMLLLTWDEPLLFVRIRTGTASVAGQTFVIRNEEGKDAFHDALQSALQ